VLTETIGILAALFPHAWLTLFGADPTMLEVGSHYLRIVGPFYGFFGAGLALYFASQGAGRMVWPLIAGTLRVVVAALGGWIAIGFGGITGLFVMLGIAMVVFGGVNAVAIASGVWFRRDPSTAPTTVPGSADVAIRSAPAN
jgi:Na+-driven multidrug efflux pump